MDASSERQLCLLVGKMIPEQFARYVDDAESGFVIFNHIAFCASPSCRKVLAENEKRVMEAIAREEKGLSRFERWKQELSNQELIHIMRERGIVK
jgi:hypothetical protein